MSVSCVTVKPSSSNSSVTAKLILINYGCRSGISVYVWACHRSHGDMCKGGGVCGCWGGCYMGICARVVGCGGVGGCYMGICGGVWGCWGGATWGYVQGWWGVGVLGGCYMGICARVVGCVGVWGVLHASSSGFVSCCWLWSTLYFLRGRSSRNVPVFVLSEG